jgi:GTPase
MKFVDEAVIYVAAGNGGNGCLSFRREANVPMGGPDGGDGGDGGSVFLEASHHINTLIDFRYQRQYKAANGQSGMGRSKRGKSASDLIIRVPVGTVVYNDATGELIGDLVEAGKTLCVAKGGFHGLGNERYKSSTNRAPRQTSKGTPGDQHVLKLELKVLADVGLLGYPNAGKSTFINQVSNAKPKIADYPFTTLHPNLGVVRVDELQSFVVADIPGLIEGASEGVGLGIQFLRHLSRTEVLLHVVDIYNEDLVGAIKRIEYELEQYSAELAAKPRWLVFNKVDLLTDEEADARIQDALNTLGYQVPAYKVSAVTGFGCQALCQDLMRHIDEGSE